MAHFSHRHLQGDKVKRFVPVAFGFRLTYASANTAGATASKDSGAGFTVLAKI